MGSRGECGPTWADLEKEPAHRKPLVPLAETHLWARCDNLFKTQAHRGKNITRSQIDFQKNRPTGPQLSIELGTLMIDVGRIEKARKTGEGWIGRCPACAEGGADKTGNHLKVWPDGRFACVVNSGKEGAQHRKRIFALVGKKDGKGGAAAMLWSRPMKVFLGGKHVKPIVIQP